MDNVSISFDSIGGYSKKPSDRDVAGINNRIGKIVKNLNPGNIKEYIDYISTDGHTFCPATFNNSSRRQENFQQMQMFVLDFDDGISFHKVKERAERYELPILFAYDTFNSAHHNRFRVSFLHDVPITNIKVAETMLKALMTIFPEADPKCKSPVQMYYGSSNGLLYFDETIPEINIESLIRNMTVCLEDRYKPNHYKRHVEKFSRDTGVALNKKGLLDVTVVNEIAETTGANDNGKNLPKPSMIKIPFGRNFPNTFFRINYGGSCTNDLCKNKRENYHLSFRSSDLGAIKVRCQLFQEFASGSRRLGHQELFGLATNLIHVETGVNLFKELLEKHCYYSAHHQYYKWEQDLRYIRGYKPYSCEGFCSYRDTCPHGTNILSTSKPKYYRMERLANYVENYVSLEEAAEDFRCKLDYAMNADEKKWYIIKAQTAIGKTETYLKLVRDSSQRVLIAVPTNKLKQEISERASALGISIIKSPSLHEIKDDLPDDVWSDIEHLYNSGRSVMPYIRKAIKEDDTKCSKLFRHYLSLREEFYKFDGHAITTHKNLLTMDVSKFDLVIIDEDIIFNSVIPNKTDVTISELKRLKKKIAPDSAISRKISKVIRLSKEEEFFTLPAVDYVKGSDGKPMGVDVPSLCSATHFCFRKASGKDANQEDSQPQDCISFLNPVRFRANTKYVMVSATVDETICEYYFGRDNMEFYECSRAEYDGTLNQYYDKPMSRAYIDKDRTVIDRIKEWSKFKYAITFLKYHKGDLHFGNTAGHDFMKGENIDVIGTPHQPEWIYKLFAYSLGLDCDLDAKINPGAVIEHNGWGCRFAAYDDKMLRAIQFYLIESELEQAVGRARLLRCDCTVNLYSNFPLRQAVMRESVYDDEGGKNRVS